ncbi:MAG TPA: glycosyltransferase [Oscillospiraceae bacterium]|nr:glycosyltransferase [Oscillospiraceae bacterium]
MKIGQFSDSFLPVVDGVGRVVQNYADILARRGHEVYVVTPMAFPGYRGGLPYELLDFTGLSVPNSPYKTGLPPLDAHYHARMEHVSFDLIHAHTPFLTGLEALRLADRCACPLVSTFHSKYYDDFYRVTRASALAHLGVRFIVEFYERCDEVWAVSRSSADVLRGYGYRGEIQIMENGAEIREIRESDRLRAAETFSIPDDMPVLLYVGQLDLKKNLAHILEAAALLQKEGRRFALLFAGQGPDREALAAKAEELGVPLRFTGHVTDRALLDGLYQCADLFVFPSLYDTSSLVLREAAVMGTPSVVTRGGAPAEVVRDGENGLLAEDTAESLAAAIGGALSDPASLPRMGEAARETIPVSWETMTTRVEGRYEALAARYRDASEPRRRALLLGRRNFLGRLREKLGEWI